MFLHELDGLITTKIEVLVYEVAAKCEGVMTGEENLVWSCRAWLQVTDGTGGIRVDRRASLLAASNRHRTLSNMPPIPTSLQSSRHLNVMRARIEFPRRKHARCWASG